MLETLLWLIGYQLLGETLARGLHLPIPGAVIGMMLLFLTLCVRRSVPENLGKGVSELLSHMSLFFVPAGVGVMAYTALLKPYLLPLTFVLLGSLVVTMIGSAYLLRFMLHRRSSREETE